MCVVGWSRTGNRVILGERGRQYAASLAAQDVNWIAFDSLANRICRCTAQNSPGSAGTLRVEPLPRAETGDGIRVLFDTPQRSVTPGRIAIVFTTATGSRRRHNSPTRRHGVLFQGSLV